ncbi:DUF4445 domain-containing protein [Butyrivibrio sp. X503]|uniref:ASKHA domain-containing protein n=1 Tax=Butyrivibrio sp. X503 TaxID=2364878 RepID=UPI000EA95756|nr:ASKHA domain-containing protein [Butyrivibrio sp. X503]RKM54631.1 DUF4445 domain-containing protein [Butyrivibrio sp. X503]
MKKIRIRIKSKGRIYDAQTFKGKLLKDVFGAEGISFLFPCGGTGRCGKCKVKFESGAPRPTAADLAYLREKELSDGYRLLCRCVLESDCEVSIGEYTFEDDMVAESVDNNASERVFDKYGIAVDIGTTTIAAALLGVNDSGESAVIDSTSCVNHQRQYGDDVISRIAYASDNDGLNRLNEIVTLDVKELVDKLRNKAENKVSYLVITGNTTMLHLFRNISVESLGRYPYETTDLDIEYCDIYGIKTVIMPGFTAFVGADILSGVYFMDLIKEGEKSLLLDLGTNGEMAFYDGSKLKICSTAAGPVFEGGTISCGVPSIPGAISHIKINKAGHKVSYETIGGKAPIGLCGTGVMEAVSELVRVGVISSDGLLSDEFFDEGFPITEDKKVSLKQEDIRNVQLAKAAVNSGIRQLLSGETPDRVCISGGFGTNIDYDAIRPLKLFPDTVEGNCVGAGNTALKGALKYLAASLSGDDRVSEETALLTKIKESATELILANKDDFDDTFVEAMNF